MITFIIVMKVTIMKITIIFIIIMKVTITKITIIFIIIIFVTALSPGWIETPGKDEASMLRTHAG